VSKCSVWVLGRRLPLLPLLLPRIFTVDPHNLPHEQVLVAVAWCGPAVPAQFIPPFAISPVPPLASPFHPSSTPRADAHEAGDGWWSWWHRVPPCRSRLPSPSVFVVVPPVIHPLSSCSQGWGGWCVIHHRGWLW
jgi:hypothetical protein